jgi:fused signal recognition particle receptor
MGLFSGLKKFAFGAKIDDEYFDELEEQLIMADAGVETASKIVENLRTEARHARLSEASQLGPVIRKEVEKILDVGQPVSTERPQVILMIGVNGVGKTTTIGKLAKRFSLEGKKVILAAADTFRAAAVEQLTIWAERTGAQIIAHSEGADPAAVVHDAIEAGKARGADVIICDTAGRLQNKKNLMDELAKIRRVIEKGLPGSKPEVLLVIDATTGQNGLSQAIQFREAAGVNGIVLTKLDGTAKGGIVIAIADQTKLPVRYVGVGEGADDLYPFDAKEYADDLFGGNADE